MAKVCQPRKSSGWDPVTNSEVECWNACQTICGPDQMSCDSTDANGKFENIWESKCEISQHR